MQTDKEGYVIDPEEGVVITFLRVDAARSFAKRHFPGKAFKIIQNETAVAVSGYKLKVVL